MTSETLQYFIPAKCQNNLAINILVNPKIVNVHKTNPVQTDGSFYCRYIGTKIIIFTFFRKDKWLALPGGGCSREERRARGTE